MEDNGGAINDMVIQIGNKHKTVPPTISPLSGMSVDIILHGTFRNARFVTLRKPPFTKSSLGWGYFELTAFITLREGWEWVSSDAISSTSKGDRRDRLAMKWMLDFDRHGSQSLMMEQFRRRDSWDDIVESLQNLFVDAE
ncbi:hypothetical protein M406DRAFT_354143 [Cryphonectria parasitica EP155]|uniref:YEATS domain-containing protein n=1 Tax=Cryphonectria parasitica (strain ATCC 38755 / EP155) TaxID=660469 RepID=A0A9P5CU62_CRYP1|nr:uncharacterized protein M406DRAFT_354143 [Cryphonectria parasitica EP155]KAF3769805.1 hypothetical protein M406DRAFT_354143 [Cryphonectria parasitica EP155]